MAKADTDYLEFRNIRHTERMLATADDYTVTGVRLESKKDANEPGMVVTFTREEAPSIIKVIKEVLAKRGK
jgi:CTP:phosphocholine cytidylyltransferase-like protein